MNKIGICAAVLVLLSVLCCCNQAKDIILLKTQNYNGHCKIQYGDSELAADIRTGENGEFTFSVTEPETISGMILSWTGEGLRLEFAGVSWQGGSGYYPETSVASAIKNCFTAAGSAGAEATRSGDGEYVLQGGSASGDYIFTFDDNGLPKSLSLPALDLNAGFEEKAE